MKKILLALTLITFGTSAFAQVPKPAVSQGKLTTTLTNSKTLDTCTNATDTVVFVLSGAELTHGSIQVVASRISGTAVITGYFEQSNDGVVWSQKALADTVNLKPAANANNKNGTFQITQNNYNYYRVRFIGHNTAAVQIRAVYCRKKD